MHASCYLTASLTVALTLSTLSAAEFKMDLSAKDAPGQWRFMDKTAVIRDGELILDGRKQMSRAFYLPLRWKDVTLRAKFLVEPENAGVLACGFIVRAADAVSYYYVHFDRKQAILVRSGPDGIWNEIKRVGGLQKPAGQWHDAQLICIGDTLRVSLNGELLFEAQDRSLGGGRIGFYANQGRAHVRDIIVSGTAEQADKPFVVPPPQFVYVCQDAGAGGYEAFPDVCRLQDGRLMIFSHRRRVAAENL